MIDKKDSIKDLLMLKLVLGNGFDLHCHLETKYSDYFVNNKNKYDYMLRWTNSYGSKVQNFINLKIKNHSEFWEPFEHFEAVNVWDFYFLYVSCNDKENQINYDNIEKWHWCDVESKIQESLILITEPNCSKINWDYCFKLLNEHYIDKDKMNLHNYYLAAVIYKKAGEKIVKNKESFYNFLLSELKLFENNFGKYIRKIHDLGPFGVNPKEKAFKHWSKITIDDLCGLDSIVSVDTFNYDTPEIEELEEKVHNINGNVDYPIFGIDSSSFTINDPRFIFTKTNRRMEFDMINVVTREKIPFQNVIVFGHSLNKADYSYFFSILDKMEITDLSNDNVIVFAFSIYNSKAEEKIKYNLRSGIFNLFRDYSIYKGNKDFPNRLLDALTTQGKVIMYEIPYYDPDTYIVR